MSRRYPDMRRPAPHWSAGEAIGVSIGAAVGVLVFAFMIWVAATMMVVPKP